MKKIEFLKEAKATIVASIRRYFYAELDQPIGALPAEFLLDFFSDEIGAHYYNQGLRDAHAALLMKMEDLAEDI
ncbi:DUF2164 domain-containing protein, partial [Rhizobium leguminosarum]|uniref:DUF2164 domain-containing protein n=1 Tax=Rhizobium leguminosarum TaxID=384 RepID=UPI003F9A8202